MARSSDLGAVIRRICQVAVVAAVLVVSVGFSDAAQLPKATIIVTLALTTLGWIGWRAARGDSVALPPRSLGLAVVVFLSTASIAVLGADSMGRALVGPYGRWSGMAVYVACGVFMLVVAAHFSLRDAAGLLHALAVATLRVSLYGLFQRLGFDPISWRSAYGDKVFASLGNPNFAAAVLGIGMPIWLWIAFSMRTTGGRAAAGLVIALHLLVQLWTGSLQGPVVTIIGLWVFGYAMARSLPVATRRRVRGGLVGAAGIGLFLGVIGYLGQGPLAILDWTTVQIRLRYWETGLGMFLDEPIRGFGFTGYAARYRQYRSVEAWQSVGVNFTNDAPHNVVLDMFVSGGVPLGLAYLVVLGVVTWTIVRAIAEVERHSIPLVACVAGSWAGYVAQLLVSIDVPPLAVVGWTLGGLAVAVRPRSVEFISLRRSAKHGRVPQPAEMAGVAILILLATLGSVAMVRQAVADRLHTDGVVLVGSDPSTAYRSLVKAHNLAPWEPRYVRELANLLDATGQQPAALNAYEAAAVIDPFWWDTHIASARLAAYLGDLARSAAWYERVLEIEPLAPEMKAEAAQVALLRGDAERAIELLTYDLDLVAGRADWWLLYGDALDAAGQSGAGEARCTALGLDPTLDVACGSDG